jgi:hypothetical protein
MNSQIKPPFLPRRVPVCREATIAVALVVALSGCGSDASGGVAASNPLGSSHAAQPTATSTGLSPRSLAKIDLRRVVLHSNAHEVTATFTTYNRLRRPWLEAPACGQVGIGFESQKLVLLSSSVRAFLVSGERAVPQTEVTTTVSNPHTITLAVPRRALGSSFLATEAWRAFSDGYNCPPGGASEDETPLVIPSAG